MKKLLLVLLVSTCIFLLGHRYTDEAPLCNNSIAPIASVDRVVNFGAQRLDFTNQCHENHMVGHICNHSGSALFGGSSGLTMQPTLPRMAAIENLPAGTLIIALDDANQASDARIRQAYGLAVRLLHAEIPLKWIINSSKTSRTGIDFTASVTRVYPSAAASSSRSFRSSAIAIFPGFEAQADPIITSFGNNIRIYELDNSTAVDVHSNLTHKPRVLVELVNTGIHTGILDAAGLDENTHYFEGDIDTVDATTCFTMISVPHNESITQSEIDSIKSFTRNGGTFFAQCAAVRGFQGGGTAANRLFTGAGWEDEPGLGTFQYDNPTEPSAQFEGNIADEGGSLTDWSFDGNDPAGGTRIVHDANNHLKAYAGRIDGFSASSGGYIHFLAGHDHSDQGANRLDADRFYLNAVLRSADRPESCGLNLGPIAVADSGTIDCGNASVTINVLTNDSNPLGGSLTVNLLSSGTNGTFVNNNDGTVTYTGNIDGFWGGDQITYEACDGSVCSGPATITITSSNPSQLTISGTVFQDDDEDGDLDGGESGPSGITVNLYNDDNSNGVRDGGESLEQTTMTGAGGSYGFTLNTVPTSNTMATITTTKATGNYEGNDDEGYGSCDEIFIEEDGGFRGHVFIEFDLSNLPTGCTVNSANLRLVLATGHSGDNFDVQVRRVTNPWVEGNGDCDDGGSNTTGVTWDQRSPGNNWATAGGDFAATVYATFNGGDDDPNGTVYNINVASLVNDWLSGSPNHGLVLIPASVDQSGGDDWFYIYSDDASDAADRPQLEVSVTCTEVTDYVIEVDATTLPAGATFTTDNVETASFTDLGQLDCNNNFGFIACPDEPDAGTDGADELCEGETTPVNLFNIITGEDSGGSWAQTSGPTSLTVGGGTSVNFSSAAPGTYVFTYTVMATNCPTDQSTATITVVNQNEAGTPLPALQICETNTTTVDLFSRLTGEDAGGTWTAGGSNPSGGTFNAGAGTFNPTGAGVGTYSFTYTFAASGPCPLNNATVQIVVAEQKTAGTPLPPLEICETSTTVIDLFTRLNGEDAGGTWTAGGSNPSGGTFNAGAGTFDPTGSSVGTYTFTYSFTAMGGCIADDATIAIEVSEQFEAGTPLPPLEICETSTTVIDLFTRLNGEDAGGTWTAGGSNPSGGTFNAGAGTFDPTGSSVGTYTFTYSFTAMGGCVADDATIAIEVSEQFEAGTPLPPLEICETSTTVIDLFTRLNGEDAGGTWTAGGSNPSGGTFNAGAGTFDPTGSSVGTYTFTYSFAAMGGCIADDATIAIEVSEQFEAGTPLPPLEICETSTTVIDLFTRLNGEDAGGTWTAGGSNPSGGTFNAGAGTFDPTGSSVGTYTFTYSFAAMGGCVADDATITIEVSEQFEAGTALGVLDICDTSMTSVDLFTRLNGEDAGGTWTAGGSNPSGGTFNAGAGTFDPTGSSVGTYTFTYSFAAMGGCIADDETITIEVIDCCPAAPVVSIGEIACVDGSTYEYTFSATPGATVISKQGTISGNTVSVAVGTNDTLLVYNAADCDTVSAIAISPTTCTDLMCEQPDLTTANAVCNGATYSVAFTETTGATISTQPGSYTIGANTISGIPLGTTLILTATNPEDNDCVVSLSVPSPLDCDDPCPEELISVSALGVCSTDGATYTVNFTATSGVAITTIPTGGGIVVGANTISGIPSGTSIRVIGTSAACNNADSIDVVSPNCCPAAPVVSIGEIACVDGSTYEYTFSATPGATVISKQGMISGNTVSVAVGTNDTLLVYNAADCDTVSAIAISPVTCTDLMCEQPDLTTANAVCDGATYSVAFTETTGATISTGPGSYTIGANTISGIPIGTTLILTATNPEDNDCVVSLSVPSPADCDDPCPEELISVSALGVCSTDGATYTVNYTATSGVAITTVPTGGSIVVGANTISGIPSGTGIRVIGTSAACNNADSIDVVSPDCCPAAPVVSIGELACVDGSTYEYTFSATPGATVISKQGTISGNTVSVAVGTNDTLLVYNAADCDTVSAIAISPTTCTDLMCEQPDLTTANAVCNGATYSVAFTETTGATISTQPGSYTIGANTISGIPLGTTLILTATNPEDNDCVVSLSVPSPADCDDPCPEELISVSALGVCSTDGATYTVNFTATSGVAITTIPTGGGIVVGANTISGIPSGTGIRVIGTSAACNNADSIDVVSPDCCPAAPVVSIGQITCVDGSTYKYNFSATLGATVVSTQGMISGNMVTVDVGTNDTLLVYNAVDCDTVSAIAISPVTCTDLMCEQPDLTTANAVCDGATYSVAFTETTGATISTGPGSYTIGANTISGIPLGTTLILTATNPEDNDCVVSLSVPSPLDCDDPCPEELISVSALGVCSTDGATYTVNFTATSGVAITTIPTGGSIVVGANTISGIPSGTGIRVIGTSAACNNADSIDVMAPDCCVEIEAFVYLEGSLIVPQTGLYSTPMRTTLNDSRLLPGQFKVDIFLGNTYTPPLGTAGQVYNIDPWNYSGGEGALFDSEENTNNADANYPTDVVDWVLVSLRTDPENGSEAVCQRAGLLHSDGRITFPSDDCCSIDQNQSYYIVIEHRNHLIVMSHEAVAVVNGKINYDFRDKQSYLNDIFGVSIAQKEVIPGVYAMYAGNGAQSDDINDDVDINAADGTKHADNGSEVGVFKLVDYNMDGDISTLDFELWQRNSPRFTSVKRD